LEVAQDLEALGASRGRQLLGRALDQGIDSVPDAPASLRRLFAAIEEVPDWVDFEQLRRGGVAYLRGGPLVAFTLASAVIGANERAYGITRTLAFTGRMTGKLVGMRARETTRWLTAATRPGAMTRYSEGFKLTVQVRMVHARTRARLSRSPDWDWNGWGMPLSDTDGMYAVCYDFTQALIDALTAVGVRYSARELDDIYALWRYIGYIIGVPEHLLPTSAAHARQLAAMYLAIDPGPDEKCRDSYQARMSFAAGLHPDALQIFPRPVIKLFSPERLLRLLFGFTRYWVGADIADALAVPDTAWKHAPPLVRPIMWMIEFGRAMRVIDDLRLAEATIRLLERACAPAPPAAIPLASARR
jgi:hypothetical protein